MASLQKEIGVFTRHVPALKKPWNVLLTVLYTIGLSVLCAAFFFFVDGIAWYGPMLSQLVMAVIVTLIGYFHFEVIQGYREKYGQLAYQVYFYHWIIPYLVTWYACLFHPLFIPGPALLPWWMAAALGGVFFVLSVLTTVHIKRSDFNMMTHGMDLYSVFPEKTAVVYGNIYSYIRHPLYFALSCACFAFGFFRNSAAALLAAALQLIPALAIGVMEDRELIRRAGEPQKAYIQETAVLFPIRRLWPFLKMLFFIKA
jgi:protein-S-isoprenylcysteine O-methyltransferase Ste14